MRSVLIVDDSRAMRMLVRRALATGGFPLLAIREASDGKEAFDLVVESKPDLILSDSNMGDWGGLRLLQHLNQAGLWVPTILMAAEATPEMYITARQHGAFDVVGKPFTPEELAGAVRRAAGASARR